MSVHYVHNEDLAMNVADFRKNIRRALNEADNGREVIIERYGQKYQLVSLVGEPDENGVYHGSAHDYAEDDGRLIEAGQEHVVEFTVPEPEKAKPQADE